jgi:hypothetical protein
MAVTLVATVGGATANTYATLADAATFAEELWPTPVSWLAAGDQDTRARCLVEATRILDTLTPPGELAATTQALRWPREGVSKQGGSGELYLSTEIPADVIRAQILLAMWLLDQTTDPALAADAGLSSISFGGTLSMSFEPGATGKSPLERFLYQRIFPVLGPLVYMPQPRIVRG